MKNKQHSEILILGGGVIGIACAYYLLKAGRQVRIIEQNEIGSGSSHGNCGWACFSDIKPLCEPGLILDTLKQMIQGTSRLSIKPRLDPGLLYWLYQFSTHCNDKYIQQVMPNRFAILDESKQLFNALLKDENVDCDWSSEGILLLCKDEQHMSEYQASSTTLKEWGMPIVPLVGADLIRKEPAIREDVYGGWFQGGDGFLRPDKLVAAWKDVILKQGAIIEENCTVESINTHGGMVTDVQTSRGLFSADKFVVAMGAWSPKFAKQLSLKIPVQPGKGYSITTSVPSSSPKIACYFSEKSVIATPWRSGFRVGGLMSFSGYDNEPEKKKFQKLKDASKEYLKEPFGEHLEEEWTGLRPMSCDDMPIIGWSPVHQNVMLATGHSMLGIAMSPATGKLVTDLITGEEPTLNPEAFTVRRFQ